MSIIRKKSAKSGKIMQELYASTGDIFKGLTQSAGKRAQKLYGEKKGLKRLRS